MRQGIPKVLFIGNGPDGARIMEILNRFASVTQVHGVPGEFPAGDRDAYDAVFCECDCNGQGRWKEVLEKAAKLDRGIPVIVLSHSGCEKEWVEVLQAGAFDFLVPPYTNYQILSVLEHAIASRRKTAQYATA
jgi:DNA-binding NtrC family response regulator